MLSVLANCDIELTDLIFRVEDWYSTIGALPVS